MYETVAALHDVKRIYHPKGFQLKNNCYAYGVNDRDYGTKNSIYQAHPGERTLGPESRTVDILSWNNTSAFTDQTIRGAVSDGMIYTGKAMGTRVAHYRVALYIRPAINGAKDGYEGNEYHFVRQNRDGTWSHKYGAMNVTNIDYEGRIITNPAKAAMANYRFVGYFLVPKGGLDVGPIEEFATRPASPRGYKDRMLTRKTGAQPRL